MRKPLGRPPLPKASRRSRRVTVYLTPDEYRALMGGRKRSQAISDYLRDTLLGSCQATPAPSPPPAATPTEASSTMTVTKTKAIASERATALQASPPITRSAVAAGACPGSDSRGGQAAPPPSGGLDPLDRHRSSLLPAGSGRNPRLRTGNVARRDLQPHRDRGHVRRVENRRWRRLTE